MSDFNVERLVDHHTIRPDQIKAITYIGSGSHRTNRPDAMLFLLEYQLHEGTKRIIVSNDRRYVGDIRSKNGRAHAAWCRITGTKNKDMAAAVDQFKAQKALEDQDWQRSHLLRKAEEYGFNIVITPKEEGNATDET